MESTKQGGVIAYVCSSSSTSSQESCMSDSSNSQSPSSSPRPPTNKKRVTEPPAKSTHTRRHTADKTSTKSSITKLNGMVLLCKVCGDVASGFHYGVHACEGCKGFFRRSIQQNIQYKKCLKTESCTIVRINRNRCQQCRFRKCLSVGMSRDAVRFGRIPKREKQRMLLEMQTAMNNMMNNSHTMMNSSQIQHILHAAPCPSDSSSSSSSSSSPPDSPRSESVTMDTSMSSASSCSSDSGEEDTANAMYTQTRTMSGPETQLNRCPKEEEDEELWSRWNGSPAETSSNGNNDNQAHRGHLVCPMNVSPFVDPCKAAHEVWEDFSRSFIPAVRDVVEFAKQIPGFQDLSTHDQVNLLKAGTFEVLMVRLASLFDARARTVTFMSGRTFSVDALRLAGAGELLGCMFDFSEKLSALQLHHEEMSLFTAVVLVSADRSAIENVNAVEALQETLIRALRNLIMKNHSNESAIFTKLLLKLPELRSLNNMHSEELLAFQIHA